MCGKRLARCTKGMEERRARAIAALLLVACSGCAEVGSKSSTGMEPRLEAGNDAAASEVPEVEVDAASPVVHDAGLERCSALMSPDAYACVHGELLAQEPGRYSVDFTGVVMPEELDAGAVDEPGGCFGHSVEPGTRYVVRGDEASIALTLRVPGGTSILTAGERIRVSYELGMTDPSFGHLIVRDEGGLPLLWLVQALRGSLGVELPDGLTLKSNEPECWAPGHCHDYTYASATVSDGNERVRLAIGEQATLGGRTVVLLANRKAADFGTTCFQSLASHQLTVLVISNRVTARGTAPSRP